jgi:hypothetical protein
MWLEITRRITRGWGLMFILLGALFLTTGGTKTSQETYLLVGLVSLGILCVIVWLKIERQK